MSSEECESDGQGWDTAEPTRPGRRLQRLPRRVAEMPDEWMKGGVIEITHRLPESRDFDRKRPSPLSEAETEARLRELTSRPIG